MVAGVVAKTNKSIAAHQEEPMPRIPGKDVEAGNLPSKSKNDDQDDDDEDDPEQTEEERKTLEVGWRRMAVARMNAYCSSFTRSLCAIWTSNSTSIYSRSS